MQFYSFFFFSFFALIVKGSLLLSPFFSFSSLTISMLSLTTLFHIFFYSPTLLFLCVKVHGLYSLSKYALREDECIWLIKFTRQGSLNNVGHFNTPPHVWYLLTKHVFNNGREKLIIVKGTFSYTM